MKIKDKHEKQKKQTVLTSMTSKVPKLLKRSIHRKAGANVCTLGLV